MEQLKQKAITVVRLEINAVDCPHCGVVFGISDDYEQKRRDDHGRFYCPSGHGMSYGGDTWREKAQRLRGELDQATAYNSRLSNELMDQAKEMRRVRRRANAGVCQHCHRSFVNVARHVKTKHPEATA